MNAQRRPDLIVIPGDGIGHEVIGEAVRILEWFVKHRGFDCNLRHERFGTETWRDTGKFMRDGLLDDMKKADAVLFGAMGGGPEADLVPQDLRRRYGLLAVRKELGVFANIRPIKPFPALAGASSLRPDIIKGVDIIVVRELNGGIYFGQPRGIETLPDGQRRGVNTQVYTTSEIIRIARVAFDLARGRTKRVTSVDKANVMESGALWREEVQKLHDAEYPDIKLNHMYIDNASLQIVRAPLQFDVVLTDNIFGDILSDCASVITGSLGMLPSASINMSGKGDSHGALYEPVHGAAPDIAGQGKANPLGAIMSFGMALEHAFGRKEDAQLLERAVSDTLAANKRTADIAAAGIPPISTKEMGDAVMTALGRLSN